MSKTNTNSENKVLELRKEKGITQAELAELSGISIRTVQRIESGKVKPYEDTLKKIAAALSVEIGELKEPVVPIKKLILIHLSPLSGFILPLFQLFAPFFLWLFYRTDYSEIDIHVRDIIAFHFLTTLFLATGLILINFSYSVGYFLAIGTIVLCTSLTLWNAYRLSENKNYKYLNTLRERL